MARTTSTLLALAALSAPAAAQATPFGFGCAGGSGIEPTIGVASIPYTGHEFFLEVSGPAFTPGVLFLGLSNTTWDTFTLPLDLSTSGLPGCYLWVSLHVQRPFITGADGTYRFEVTGHAPGETAYAQAFFTDLDFGTGSLGGLSHGLQIDGAGPPSRGDLVISEIMYNPAYVSDGMGEWFEVYNPLEYGVNVEGFRLTDNGGTHVVDVGGAGLIVPPGGHLVFGRKKGKKKNGGVPVDYAYGDDLRLRNQGSEFLRINAYDGSFIDRVAWGKNGFESQAGRSLSLDQGAHTESKNDFKKNWCASTAKIGGEAGSTDRGTPGQMNPYCD